MPVAISLYNIAKANNADLILETGAGSGLAG